VSIQLNEEQYTLVRQYVELLSSIEEGFQYVHDSFSNFEKTEGDRVLADIIDALLIINHSNQKLGVLFSEDNHVIENIEVFNQFVASLEDSGDKLLDLNQKVEFVSNQLFPSFVSWKSGIEKTLSPYLN
jgi:hypothetical protein